MLHFSLSSLIILSRLWSSPWLKTALLCTLVTGMWSFLGLQVMLFPHCSHSDLNPGHWVWLSLFRKIFTNLVAIRIFAKFLMWFWYTFWFTKYYSLKYSNFSRSLGCLCNHCLCKWGQEKEQRNTFKETKNNVIFYLKNHYKSISYLMKGLSAYF